MERALAGMRWLLLAALLALGISACAPTVTREPVSECPPATTTAESENQAVLAAVRIEELEAALAQQRQQILGLELRLLARQSDIQYLSSVERDAVQEVVRAKAKLRSLNSKAETVANLAEVKLALQGMVEDGESGLSPERMAQAEQYVDMSEAALADGNVDGAAYLIGQARSYLRVPESPSATASVAKGQLRRFPVPVRMILKRRANVRGGPGTDSDVLTQLDAGTSVTATGYADLWVRIQSGDELTGWVHYGLLNVDR